MPLDLQPVDREADFPSLARRLFESYEVLPQPFFHIFFPIHNTTTNNPQNAREEAIAEAAARLKLWLEHDKSMSWQKVVDTETGRIAGGALWNIHEENPFADPAQVEVSWFPRGRGAAVRGEGVGEPCSASGACGAEAAPLPTRWASTSSWTPPPYGRLLYEANGFRYIEENVNIPVSDEPDEEWKRMEEKVGPFTFWLMWRPVNGVYEGRETPKST
ncbi:GNAT family acetyltransferase [Apiospora aurea]|uniref:GNAT family acetyltransferase n=1 Tax=Apiospora aurea TaxID=335848 RepID=A0ABR1QGF9_9PEZI